MNFLMLRSNQIAASEQAPPVRELQPEENLGPAVSTTLECLIAQDPFTENSSIEYQDGFESETGRASGSRAKRLSQILDRHIDVTGEEGWITIPNKELPDNWSEAPDILSFRSLDRSFVFPGEQLHILACLSSSKQDTEVITPFKVAAVMSKNGIGQGTNKQNGKIECGSNHVSGRSETGLDDQIVNQNSDNPQKDVSTSESLLRMENHKRQTEKLLQTFRNSHFFVRIAESDELLWSKKRAPEPSQMVEDTNETPKKDPISAVIERGSFNACASGGAARNDVHCCSLPNGDIVVLLQVNVGIDFVRDPVLEILQFEKHQDSFLTSEEDQKNLLSSSKGPCEELLKWLFPLDNSVPPPPRSLSPPMALSQSIRISSTKSSSAGSSGSQLFPFGNFRSYSMSSLPAMAPSEPDENHSLRLDIGLEDWEHINSGKNCSEKLLSFRGVSLEPERFSVHCGLEGIYIPGRRWRRKIEVIQPVEINSFAVDCNTDDLLCVQIKNISPPHAKDIVVYLDAINIIFEEASKGGPSLSLPIACIEAGINHTLPNLALRLLSTQGYPLHLGQNDCLEFIIANCLRRGEEHSFILKPATSMWKSTKGTSDRNFLSSHSWVSSAASLNNSSNIGAKQCNSPADQYAILVSCRSNYTESRLFFKHPTNWRPRISRDLMISVASDMSSTTLGPNGRVPRLPVQVLTLQACNLTSEDLTLTVLAPASFTNPPSIVSLASSPSTPMGPPFVDSSELVALENLGQNAADGPLAVSFDEKAVPVSFVLSSRELGCSHLWLQSRVPLGCIPSQSMATIKLEVLPLTDGIITLDSLQIVVKEKGFTYVPENSPNINATSSVATGISWDD